MANDVYVIENSLIKKELFLENNKIVSYTVTNNLSSKKFTPLENSEEFCLYFKWGIIKKKIPCSSLKAEGVKVCNENGTAVYKISFKAFSLRDSKVSVKLVYKLSDSKCYMRKHLELSYAKKGRKDFILDKIEFERINFDSNLKFWTLPKQKNSHIAGFPLSLGQPVYLDTLYLGSEFPAAINRIENATATVSYFSGKPFSLLVGSGDFVTYSSVLGGSEGDVFEQIRKSFFEYINDISKPVKLRRQYNSWYDNMLNINEDNIYNSFLEIEKRLTRTGEPPLDSYVADDGWNDYTKGFWCFNSKFPDELYPFKSLARNLGSEFGLWLGPRGGYTTDTPKFAKQIERAHNGYYNRYSRDICVASDKYIHRVTDLLIDFEKKFGINYFKLDGFAQAPCRSRNHDHITGGYNNMYFYTEVWEKWLNTFEQLSKNADKEEDFWINLTCYAPPSPWFLQWVNSLWIQISDDVGFIGKKKEVSDKDRMLSYRDEKYFDFYRDRQFQFPQRALYNHDPIYGNEAKVSMTDDEFRVYLFTMATRGTAFWELYYSYSMMNEAKSRINYSVLRFIEENMDVLSNSVIFGGRPSENAVYGYSCFNDSEGIVSLRNSSGENKNYTLRLDETIGVKKTFKGGKACTVLPYTVGNGTRIYNYSDSITVELAPFETRILHFGKRSKPLKAEYVKAKSLNTIEIQFNQFVDASAAVCEGNTVKSVELLEDYMSCIITFENPFAQMNKLTLCGISDIMGNASDVDIQFDYYPKDEVTGGGIFGKGDFTIVANISSKAPCVLFRQGNEIELSTDSDGVVRFRVGDNVLKTEAELNDVVQIIAVRERNNVLKLYLNKKLCAGMPSEPTELSGEKFEVGEGVIVNAVNRALGFDEV